MRMKAKNVAALVFFGLMAFGASNVSADPQSPRQAIETFFEKINAVKFPVANIADYERDAAMASVYLDLTAMGKKALRAHWDAFSIEERAAFSDLLEKLVRAIAYPRAQKFLSAQTVTYAEPKPIDRGVEVTSTTKARETGLEIPIVYHLYNEGGQWKIYDVFLDGISMTEDLQYQFDRLISDGGPAELLKQMQIRLDRANSENGSAPSALNA